MADTKVFISYSSVDRADAVRVRRLLAARGCSVWLDVFDIRVSAELKHELGSGIAAADVLCLLLSPTAVASPWVAEEIARGLDESARRGLRMVNVLLRPCRPPDVLLGKVLLDATEGLDSPAVAARLARAVLGSGAVGDDEIDAALQASLQAREQQLLAAAVLPDLVKHLTLLRERPFTELSISFNPGALPPSRVLALSLTFDELFSQPMWFLFARYREGSTWPRWMSHLGEREPHEVRADGKRIDGRFQWFERVEVLDAHIDGTDLQELPAVFSLELDGSTWTPGGTTSTYPGGPGMPRLPQTMQLPPLAKLVERQASFHVALLGPDEERQDEVVAEENDLDVQVTGVCGDETLHLFRSRHSAQQRAVLKGVVLSRIASPIEREAVLGLYEPPHDPEADERERRREAAHALLEAPEDDLSPEERRIVGLLRMGEAELEMSRVFNAAPPPGSARDALHLRAIEACRAVCRLLTPLAVAEADIDDVGRVFKAASSLAHYYTAGQAPERGLGYAEHATAVAERAAARAPDEPLFRRWLASASERLAAMTAMCGRRPDAMRRFDDAIAVREGLLREWPSEGRLRDLRRTLDQALKTTQGWRAQPALRRRWKALAEGLPPAA